jgi:hypothetical protein
MRKRKVCFISGPNFKIILKKLDTWHSIQVHSLEKANNQQIFGKLPQLSLGTSNFGQICEIAKKTYRNTTRKKFELKKDKILEIR